MPTNNSRQSFQVSVYDISGRLLEKTPTPVVGPAEFGSQFSDGVYIVKILCGNQLKTVKMIKAAADH